MADLIPQEKIAEIQHASDIVQIISEHVHLRQSGKNFIGLCPFHHEKTPSFTVNPEKKLFKCFGCGEGGTVFGFIMKREGVTFLEAVRLIASKCNIDLPLTGAKGVHSTASEKGNLLKVTSLVADFYHHILLNSAIGQAARDYLQLRRINDQSIKNFHLGYAPDTWDALIEFSKKHNISVELLEKTGLAIPRKGKDGYYDRFRNRLIFPISNVRGQIIGFGGRALNADTQPKYLNSPETCLFRKGENLYGIDIAKNSIMKQRRVILMEGYTDVIMAHQYGIDWAVAVLGTALSRKHLRLLRQYCNQAILLLDSDTAGLKSSERSLDMFVEEEFEVKIAQLPQGYDPCEFLIAEGAEKFLVCINHARDLFSFKIDMASKKWDMTSVQGKAQAIDEVILTAMKAPDPIKRNLLLNMIADEMSIDESVLRGYIRKFNKRKSLQAPDNQLTGQRLLNTQTRVEREIIYLMISCDSLIPRIVENMLLERFQNEELLKIAKKVIEIYQEKSYVKEGDVLLVLDNAYINILVDIITSEEFKNTGDYLERLEACIRFFEKQAIKKEAHQAKKKTIDVIKSGGNEEELVVLLHEFHRKKKGIHALKLKKKGLR